MDSVDGRDKLLADLIARTANGAAPRFIAPHTERSRQRAQTTITRILQDPTVRAELARIRELVGPIEPPPGHDSPLGIASVGPRPRAYPGRPGSLRILGVQFFRAGDPDYWNGVGEKPPESDNFMRWLEQEQERSKTITRECRAFAAHARLPYAPASDIAWIMSEVLSHPWPGEQHDLVHTLAAEYRGPAPVVFMNPLADRDLTLTVPPGRILVDVTNASSKDLGDLAKPLAELQALLGYAKQRGRTPDDDQEHEEQMTFIHAMRTSRTGRGKTLSWQRVTKSSISGSTRTSARERSSNAISAGWTATR